MTAGWSESGVASWYGDPFHGRLTASGEVYDMDEMTAAHRTLPFGTLLHVRSLDNGRETTVRINDRGPFVRGRDLDLSRQAARELEMIGAGTARIRMTILEAAAQPSCWEIQIGAFAARANAEAVVDRTDPMGQPVRIVQAEDGLYRVRIGPLRSRSDAEVLADRADGILLGCPVPA